MFAALSRENGWWSILLVSSSLAKMKLSCWNHDDDDGDATDGFVDVFCCWWKLVDRQT